MVVDTQSEEAGETRKFVLEMLLSDHPNDCMICEVNGDCELQDLAYEYNALIPIRSSSLTATSASYAAGASVPAMRCKTAMCGTSPTVASGPSS
jgi:predicted molibdopterin-dependent oxidoreductase YjgC